MLRRFSSFIFILFACSLWAQHPRSDKTEDAAIERVKTADVSSLDRGLPKVTLEFFLKYEGEGAPIKWRKSDCDERKETSFIDHERASATCVEAEMDLKSNRSATIVVSVGTLKTGSFGVPTLFGATVTDSSGVVHTVRHLIDLPMELHRPMDLHRPSPRDLPVPAGAALLALAVETHPNVRSS
jgi:hypothetical protein